MNTTDQWMADGRCDICRRKSYCKERCNANRRAIRKIRRAMEKLAPRNGKTIDQSIKRCYASEAALRKMCNGKIAQDRIDSLLSRCKNLAVHSTKPEYFYLEALLEAFYHGRLDLEAHMSALEQQFYVERKCPSEKEGNNNVENC